MKITRFEDIDAGQAARSLIDRISPVTLYPCYIIALCHGLRASIEAIETILA
jgi:hypothetical protein